MCRQAPTGSLQPKCTGKYAMLTHPQTRERKNCKTRSLWTIVCGLVSATSPLLPPPLGRKGLVVKTLLQKWKGEPKDKVRRLKDVYAENQKAVIS